MSLARQIERAKAAGVKPPEPKAARLAAASVAVSSGPKAVTEDCVNPCCPYRQEILKLRKRKAESQAKWRKGRS